MECGFGDSVCDVIASAIELAKSIAPWLEDRWRDLLDGKPKADDFLGPITAATRQLFDPLRPHLEALFGLAGLAFAIWRWLRHRERVLHKRLLEYLLEEDKRIHRALDVAVEAVRRPSRRRSANSPLLAPKLLRKLLKRSGWKPRSIFTSVERTTEESLSLVADRIRNQIELLDKTMKAYRNQQASVHILAGAIKSSRASRHLIGSEEREMHVRALENFRYALNVEGHDGNILALQFKADQERLLGQYETALATYQALEASATQLADLKKKCLLVSTCRRHRAVIYQRMGNNGLANGEINAALQSLSQIAPMTDWDKLEEAETHFTAAWIKDSLGFVIQRNEALDRARANFASLRLSVVSLAFSGSEARALHNRGTWGTRLVDRAKDTGHYRIDA